jgi:hypothetical protein
MAHASRGPHLLCYSSLPASICAERQGEGLTSKEDSHRRILSYLVDKYRENPQAEVSGQELSQELGIDLQRVRESLEYLVAEGLAEGELSLVNVWVRLSEGGDAILD